jgi:SH3 domain-containing YSC84-like protein 1
VGGGWLAHRRSIRAEWGLAIATTRLNNAVVQRVIRYFTVVAVIGLLIACSRSEPARSPSGSDSPQQAIVESAAAALGSMRANGRFHALDGYLASAHGVMIFPRLVKAGLVFGGEGGTGVLVARKADGAFGAPAFYSIGGGSVGLQIGYQEASLVLVFMSERALLSALQRGVTLGTDVSVAAGTMGDASQARRQSSARDIYYFADVRGVFAGMSLDGAVVDARDSHNTAYYGAGATPQGIVLEQRFDRPEADVLRRALSPQAAPATGAAPAADAGSLARPVVTDPAPLVPTAPDAGFAADGG